jgi:beta-glucosidase
MVLLKNDGVLPLRSAKRIAVVGPLADQTAVLLGNYNGTPTHTVSLLEGLKAEFPDAKITYVPGTQFLSNRGDPVPETVLTTPEGKPGLKSEHTSDGLRLTGFLNPTETGDYLLGVRKSSEGPARVSLDDRRIVQMYGSGANLGRVHLEKGHPQALRVEYGEAAHPDPQAQLIWAPVVDRPDQAAIAAAQDADVVIAAVGITSHLEGEEMPVDEPGFLGGDRTTIEMPKPEEDLVQALAATGKPLVVVLMNGSALGVNWEKAHANAVLESWYAGEEGGAAIAATLSGKNNPAGRLPVTFYKDVHQLPHFEDYSMKGRTYRYFAGEPLWPFGFRLSYTTFKYSSLSLSGGAIAAGEPLDFTATVTNTGKLAGDEVVQLYLKFPDLPGAPRRALRGFQRIHLQPGASQKVAFHLERRDLSMVTETGNIIVAQGKYTVSVGGGQPGTEAPAVSGDFQVKGQIILPE